jgi:2-hydroxycyclohexanecarboxyl-CoA dehydrogenase
MSTPRVAIVTGAARGIGAAIANALAADGFAAAGIAVDIADTASVRGAVAEVEATLGPIAALVNNAGIDVIKPFVDSTEDEWDRIIAVNLKGTIGFCRAVLDGMIERNEGRIVSIASDAGRVGSSGEAVYSATKGGVIAFNKTLAREVARHGITVNSVCPSTPRSCTRAWPRPSRCGAPHSPATSLRRSPSC